MFPYVGCYKYTNGYNIPVDMLRARTDDKLLKFEVSKMYIFLVVSLENGPYKTRVGGLGGGGGGNAAM